MGLLQDLLRRVFFGGNERLHDAGTPGTATITSVQSTGRRRGGEDSPIIYRWELRVTIPRREPYDVTRKQALDHDESEAAKMVGHTVGVRVDPYNPRNLLIEWDEFK